MSAPEKARDVNAPPTELPAPATADGRPAWFVDAIAREPQVETVPVRGCDINVLVWGATSLPTLTLVHGGSAHAHWWNFLAPLLATQHRVLALDLSGHGDSGHRATYSAELWAEEVIAVSRELGTGAPIVAGHSMGGRVTSLVASRWGDELAGAIIMDSRLWRWDPESEATRERPDANRRLTVYPDVETAVGRFRLLPAQDCENPWLLEHVARHSLRRVEGGWTWKFDPKLFSAASGPSPTQDFTSAFAGARCRVALIHGAWSDIADERTRDHMVDLLAGSPGSGSGVPSIELSEARHHLMFDRPLALYAALQSVAATWRAG